MNPSKRIPTMHCMTTTFTLIIALKWIDVWHHYQRFIIFMLSKWVYHRVAIVLKNILIWVWVDDRVTNFNDQNFFHHIEAEIYLFGILISNFIISKIIYSSNISTIYHIIAIVMWGINWQFICTHNIVIAQLLSNIIVSRNVNSIPFHFILIHATHI